MNKSQSSIPEYLLGNIISRIVSIGNNIKNAVKSNVENAINKSVTYPMYNPLAVSNSIPFLLPLLLYNKNILDFISNPSWFTFAKIPSTMFPLLGEILNKTYGISEYYNFDPNNPKGFLSRIKEIINKNRIDSVSKKINEGISKVNALIQNPKNKPGNKSNEIVPKNNTTPKMDEITQLPLTAELMWNYLLGNDELMKLFKTALGIPEQTADDKTKPMEPDKNAAPALTNIPKVPTYEDLVALNTAAFNNGINNAGWRKGFRKAFNTAVQNGTLYDKYNPSGSGTSVFDTNVTWGFDNNNNPQKLDASSILSVFAGDDGQLSRREMRRMKKWTKNAAPLQAKQNALDFLRHGQISTIGINGKVPGLPEVEPLEPDTANPGVSQGETPLEFANARLNLKTQTDKLY